MSISLSQTPLRCPLNPISSRDGASPSRTDETRYPLYEKIDGPRYAPWQRDGARMAEAERRFFAGAVAADSGDFIPMAA